jgi:hypothetical protein
MACETHDRLETEVLWIIAGPACICGLCSLESKYRHFQPADEGIDDSAYMIILKKII